MNYTKKSQIMNKENAGAAKMSSQLALFNFPGA